MIDLDSTLVFDAINFGLIIVDTDLKVLLWNNWLVKHSHISKADVLDKPLTSIFSDPISPALLRAVENALKYESPVVLSTALHRSPLPLYSDILGEGEDMLTRMPQSVIITPLRSQKDEACCLIQITDSSISIKREKILCARSEERQNLQQQLFQIQKLESIGQMTAGIAHDFNNILASIIGYTEICDLTIEDVSDDDRNIKLEASKYLREVRIAGERGVDLVNKMLIYCRRDVAKVVAPIQLNGSIEEIVQMLRATISTAIRIEVSLTEKVPSVLIGPTELHQIVANLIVNARDAIGLHGVIRINLNAVKVSKNMQCNACLRPLTGDFVEISISDTGSGMVQEQISRIFDPFFTTKEVGKGTGLGLSVVSGIMHQARGHIIVESEIDKGTTFRLFFPAVNEDIVIVEAESNLEEKSQKGQPLKILVVDDERTLVEMLKIRLNMLGHYAEVFTDSPSALARFNESPNYFDAVITDYSMSGLTGLELTESILAIRPELPILICTGYSEKLSSKEDLPKGNTYLFKKPVKFNEISAVLNSLRSTK